MKDNQTKLTAQSHCSKHPTERFSIQVTSPQEHVSQSNKDSVRKYTTGALDTIRRIPNTSERC